LCLRSSAGYAQSVSRVSTSPPEVIDAARTTAAAERSVFARGFDRDALPGTWHVPSPLASRTVLNVTASAGYGWTESVFTNVDQHHRVRGSLALAVQPLSWLSFSLRLDGRVDLHIGDGPVDAGALGEPRLNVRVAGRLTPAFAAGTQLTLIAPGAEFPSIVPEALCAETQAFAGYVPIDGPLWIVARAGFRLDQSANAARNAALFSGGDRLALGLNSAHAVLAGVAISARLPYVDPWLEWTWDALVTDRVPLAASPMTVALGLRSNTFSSSDFFGSIHLEVSPSARGSFEPDAPLFEARPRVGLILSISKGFAAPPAPRREERVVRRAPPPPPRVIEPPAVVSNTDTNNQTQQPEPPAGIDGLVRDPQGQPVAEATVIVRRGDASGEVVRELRTDRDGRWSIDEIEPGEYTVIVRTASGAERTTAVTARRGSERARAETTVETVALGAQLRGTIRAFNGEPIAATIRVVELQQTLTANADGTFSIPVEPRAYTVEFSHDGYQRQRRRATVRTNGVVILNIDLRPATPTRRPRR
jgi:hypothetical protein